MVQENYHTRLEKYIHTLKDEENMCERERKKFPDGSGESVYYLTRRELTKSHRFKLEKLFPDVALED